MINEGIAELVTMTECGLICPMAYITMYMVHVNRCPQYLTDSDVSAGSEPGRHDLRSTTNLNYILPRTRTTFGVKAFSVSGPIVWESLPLFVRLSPTLTGFKRNLKSHILTVLLTNFNVSFA